MLPEHFQSSNCPKRPCGYRLPAVTRISRRTQEIVLLDSLRGTKCLLLSWSD